MIKAGINYKFEAGVAASAKDENLQKRRHLVSVPFQSNTNFNTGLFNRTQEVLNTSAGRAAAHKTMTGT
jgi:hypothetical protein